MFKQIYQIAPKVSEIKLDRELERRDFRFISLTMIGWVIQGSPNMIGWVVEPVMS